MVLTGRIFETAPKLQGREVHAKNFGIESEDLYEAAYNGNTRVLRNLLARGGCVNISGNFW